MPSLISSLDKSRLSSIVIPHDGYDGEILTAIMKVAWSFRLYTGSLALQPSVVTAPSTPPVLETGDYGGGWSTLFRVAKSALGIAV